MIDNVMVGFQLNINHLCWWIIVSSVHHCVFKVSPSSTTRGGGLLGSNGGEDSLITTDKMLICNYYSHRITAGILSNPHIVSSLHMVSILGQATWHKPKNWNIMPHSHLELKPASAQTFVYMKWIIFGNKYGTKLILHLITHVHVHPYFKI